MAELESESHSTIDKRLQTRIPIAVRLFLHLEKNDVLAWQITKDGSVTVEKGKRDDDDEETERLFDEAFNKIS